VANVQQVSTGQLTVGSDPVKEFFRAPQQRRAGWKYLHLFGRL